MCCFVVRARGQKMIRLGEMPRRLESRPAGLPGCAAYSPISQSTLFGARLQDAAPQLSIVSERDLAVAVEGREDEGVFRQAELLAR